MTQQVARLPTTARSGYHGARAGKKYDSFEAGMREHGMRWIGRMLQQLVLFVVVPLSIVLQLLEVLSLGQMLVALVAAVSAFYLGRLIEGYAER